MRRAECGAGCGVSSAECDYNHVVRPRFYLPTVDANRVGELDEDETGHLTRVLRLGAGADVDVFDGRGGMFRARVSEVGRGRAVVQALEPTTAAPEPAVHVTLVMSVLKGDKMDAVVRDATMMGVTGVQPVVAARSEVSMAALSRAGRVSRWQRIAVASVKQCGRAVVPVVNAPVSLPDWMARTSGATVLVLTEPSAGPGHSFGDVPRDQAIDLVIGPEGGWTPEEQWRFSEKGAQFIALGGRTLRADAAPVAAMAALFEAWHAW